MKSVPTFETIAHCPYCDRIAVHYLRAPNLEPPTVVVTAEEQDEIISRSWDGRVAVHIIPMDKYDRDDEREFEVVRRCIDCGREWGVKAPDPTMESITDDTRDRLDGIQSPRL